MVATIEMMRKWWISAALMAPSAMPSDAGDGEPAQPAAAADPAERERRHILHDRRGDGERDVDAAGDQHHQQADREDQVDRAGVEQIEEIGEGEELVAGQRQHRRMITSSTTTSHVSVGWARKSLAMRLRIDCRLELVE